MSVDAVREGTSARVTVPRLEIDPQKTPSGAAEYVPRASNRIAAIAVGGVGIVGLGIGGFFGLSAQSSYSDSSASCNDGNFCTSRGTELRNSAKSKAVVSTVAVSAGVVALVTAGVLWFTAPAAHERPKSAREPSRSLAWRLVPQENAWGVNMSTAF